MTMRTTPSTRPLGSSDLTITTVGFGAWAVGGGGRTPEQVDGWVGAAGLELGDADLDEIAAALGRTGAGSGPARPGGAA
jgi:aryl-alcohol dehydrogenase-like predicted oxidoreductase